MIGGHLLPVLAHPRADVAHRVAAAADVARVGLTAVDDSAVVQAALVGLQCHRHRPRRVALAGGDFVWKHRLARRQVVVVGETSPACVVRARDDIHAAVRRGGWVDGEPDRDDFDGLDHRLPIVRVLVPRHPLAVAAWFADEVTGKKRDVRPDDGFHQVENLVGKEPLEQLRVLKVRHIHGFRPHTVLQPVEDLLEAVFQAVELRLRENRLAEDVVTFAVVGSDFGGLDAVMIAVGRSHET